MGMIDSVARVKQVKNSYVELDRIIGNGCGWYQLCDESDASVFLTPGDFVYAQEDDESAYDEGGYFQKITEDQYNEYQKSGYFDEDPDTEELYYFPLQQEPDFG